MQWGSKVKESSVLQNNSKGMASLQKGCVNLFYSQVGRDKLSLQELNKGTLQSSKGAGLSSHSRDKSPSSQSYGFSSGHVWMWELDYKEAEHQRIDAFEQWCWRRLLRVPWTARRSNYSIPKEINPEYSLEGLMLKLKLQYFDHLKQRTDSLKRPWWGEILKAGGEGDNRRWDGWMASPTQWTWVWVNSRSWWWSGKPGMQQSIWSQSVWHNWAERNRKIPHARGLLSLGAAAMEPACLEPILFNKRSHHNQSSFLTTAREKPV